MSSEGARFRGTANIGITIEIFKKIGNGGNTIQYVQCRGGLLLPLKAFPFFLVSTTVYLAHLKSI